MKIVPLGSSKIPQLEIDRLKGLADFDQQWISTKTAVGVDEVGRGPLAGPVVACACVVPLDCLVQGVGDSKKLPPAKRALVAKQLRELPGVRFAFAEVSSREIDQINIRQASLKAMRLCLEQLKITEALVDAEKLEIPGIKTVSITYGDRLSYAIGAASILAKEYRDAMMKDLGKKYPEYGFEQHMGYGTAKHRQALEKYGPCEEHRFSYAPLKDHFCRGVV